jgi:hypothetical protein
MAYAGTTNNPGTLFIWAGGDYFNNTQFSDNWTWAPGPTNGWTNLGAGLSTPPSFRLQAMFTYDDGSAGNSGGIYLFGGTADYSTSAGTTYSETWLWD